MGDNGTLFSIADSATGSLMSVNDISGLPILEVFSDDIVVMGKHDENTLYVDTDQVGIGVSTIDSSARFEIAATTSNSTVGGVLMPRMTTADRDTISGPATGLFVQPLRG